MGLRRSAAHRSRHHHIVAAPSYDDTTELPAQHRSLENMISIPLIKQEIESRLKECLCSTRATIHAWLLAGLLRKKKYPAIKVEPVEPSWIIFVVFCVYSLN